VLLPFRAGVATGGERAPIPGYVCLVARRHVVEPLELLPVELEQFWQEAIRSVGLCRSSLPVEVVSDLYGHSAGGAVVGYIYPRSADPALQPPQSLSPTVMKHRR
jgi:hypothetical protein